jgi:hypothetical protein
MIYGIQQGDLVKWLLVARANAKPGAVVQEIPQQFVDYLVNLRCVRADADGTLQITDKGVLALRMEAPDALHRQDDADGA